MKYLVTLVCACLLIVGCSKEHNNKDKKAGRTVIVYIAADCNLSSYVAADFAQMLQGSQSMPSNGNLIAYIDRGSTSDKPCIVDIKKGKADTVYVAESNTYSSDPTVMQTVLTKIMNEYPANDYGLVLWGHANGWLINEDSIASRTKTRSIQQSTQIDTPIREAYGVDNGFWMNIPTLANVLGSLPSTFKFIFADCCCFQSVESAYELRNVTDYIIGSPAEIPAVGAPYNTVVPTLFGTSATFYQDIVDAYAEQKVNGYQEPLSVIKTSEIETLASATSPLLQLMAQRGGIDRDDNIVYYYHETYNGRIYKLLYDMQDLFMNYIDDENLYNTWKAAFDNAVVYKHRAYPWVANYADYSSFKLTDDNYGGVSIFIPASYYPTTYKDGIKKMAWYYATGMDEYFSDVE